MAEASRRSDSAKLRLLSGAYPPLVSGFSKVTTLGIRFHLERPLKPVR